MLGWLNWREVRFRKHVCPKVTRRKAGERGKNFFPYFERYKPYGEDALYRSHFPDVVLTSFC